VSRFTANGQMVGIGATRWEATESSTKRGLLCEILLEPNGRPFLPVERLKKQDPRSRENASCEYGISFLRSARKSVVPGHLSRSGRRGRIVAWV